MEGIMLWLAVATIAQEQCRVIFLPDSALVLQESNQYTPYPLI